MFRPSRVFALLALSIKTEAFVTVPSRISTIPSFAQPLIRSTIPLSSTTDENDPDDEIDRLRSLASRLRAEAAELEAEKAQQMADAAERAFRKFDLNDDGEVSLEELKLGLERELKVCLFFVHLANIIMICSCKHKCTHRSAI